MLRFVPVTAENVRAVCRLDAGDGGRFVAPNPVSMAQAAVQPEAWPRAVYDGDVLVGFFMLELHPGEPDAALWRLMVDVGRQRSGLGAAIVRLVIETVRELGYRRLLLSHCVGPGEPGPFYEKLGFTYTGEMDEDERIMALDLVAPAPDGRGAHLAFAHRLADAAGAAILPLFRSGLSADDKVGRPTDIDPVTEGDRAAERAVRARIDAEHPDHGILGEEYGRREGTSGLEWVVDPIDGTRGFLSGFPTWGTLIGLRRGEDTLVGVIDQPFTQERWWGDGERAWMRTRAATTPIRARACASLADAVFSATSPETFRTPFERAVLARFQAGTRLRRYGGDCYAYALLAAGAVDVIAESGLQVYDWVALLPVLRGAGAVATAWDGGPVGHDGTLLAAGDPRVHAEALALIAAERRRVG